MNRSRRATFLVQSLAHQPLCIQCAAPTRTMKAFTSEHTSHLTITSGQERDPAWQCRTSSKSFAQVRSSEHPESHFASSDELVREITTASADWRFGFAWGCYYFLFLRCEQIAMYVFFLSWFFFSTLQLAFSSIHSCAVFAFFPLTHLFNRSFDKNSIHSSFQFFQSLQINPQNAFLLGHCCILCCIRHCGPN